MYSKLKGLMDYHLKKKETTKYEHQKQIWDSLKNQFALTDRPGMCHITLKYPNKYQIEYLTVRSSNGKLLGYIEFYRNIPENKEAAGVAEIYVDPDHQRKGVGSQLLYWALEQWKDLKLQKQELSSDGKKLLDSFTKKHKAYKKMGGII